MRPIAMAEACARAMTEPGTVGVVLTVQKGRMPRSFPRGELLNEMGESAQRAAERIWQRCWDARCRV